LVSSQRIQTSCPLGTLKVSVAESAVRFAAAFPSRAAAVTVAIGLVKSSESKSVQPVVGVLASVIVPGLTTWYWKSSFCGVAYQPGSVVLSVHAGVPLLASPSKFCVDAELRVVRLT